MRRTDLLDTSEWAHREIVRRLQNMSPEQRWQKMLEAIELGRAIDRLAKERLARAEVDRCDAGH